MINGGRKRWYRNIRKGHRPKEVNMVKTKQRNRENGCRERGNNLIRRIRERREVV